MELEKWGLGPRDLTANVNFFSRVTVGEDGGMTFHPRNSMSRSHVELRAEMNVLVVLNTCQHPLDPNPRYEPKPVRLSVRKARPAGAPILAGGFVRKIARVCSHREVLCMSALLVESERDAGNATYRSVVAGGRIVDSRNP